MTRPRSAAYRRALLWAVALVAVTAPLLYFYLTLPKPSSAPRVAALQSPYTSEEDWLVRQIVGDLADMALFAAQRQTGQEHARITIGSPSASGAGDPPGSMTVTVALPRGAVVRALLALEHSTWSPEDYEALASRLIAGLGLRLEPAQPAPRASSEHEEALLHRLLDLRADVIQTENERLSGALVREPAEPGLHEQAALLLGAFALREAPGHFSDVRPALCRMTAHLALARALRASAPASLSGGYAEAVLATLSERGAQAEATLGRLAAASEGSPIQQAWRQALLMRISDDWRLLPDPQQASLLERLAWLRAAQWTLGDDRALQTLERAGSSPGPEVDWAMILARAPSVEVGNAFLDSGLDSLLAEADAVWSRVHGGVLSPARRVAALNEPHQPFLATEGPRVIAWGSWAAQYQRHVLQLLKQTELHERRMLGLKEWAERTVSEKTRAFSGLTLFPELAARWETEKKAPDPRVLDGAISLVLQHPELITGVFWAGLAQKTVLQSLPRRLPPTKTWFTTGCPRGTGYDVAVRTELLPRSSPAEVPAAALAQLKAIAPKSYDIAYYRLFYRTKNPPSTAEVEAEMGLRMEYDLRAMVWLAEWVYERDPALVQRLNQGMCELDAEKCSRLGAWCVDQGDEACAVAAYERMVDESPDRVVFANNSRWLTRHYLRRGQRDRARKVAAMAAATGSAGGLLTMAAFLEATGAYDEAEDYIRSERKRYPEEETPHWELIGFYHRMAHVRGVRSYEAKLAELTKDIFPRGLERVPFSSFSGPPTDGVLFATDTPSLRRNGMRRGDVAVAWDGWRVRNTRQFTAIREFDDDPSFTLILWRSGEYVEVPARRQGRRFGMNLSDYRAAPR